VFSIRLVDRFAHQIKVFTPQTVGEGVTVAGVQRRAARQVRELQRHFADFQIGIALQRFVLRPLAEFLDGHQFLDCGGRVVAM